MAPPSQRLSCDVLIVGGGTAALVASLEVRKSVENVVVACKRKAGRSGNTIVSGAAFSACMPGGDVADSIEQHLQDTLAGGDGINDPALARALVSEAPERVVELEGYGVRLLRVGGSLVRRTPPGHTRPRSIPTEQAGCSHHTRGLTITLPLLEAARRRGVRILSDTPVHRLLVRDEVACGALALDTTTGEQIVLGAKAVVLAAGGGGHLFANTNNTSDMTGDSYALALEAGAPLRDMEMVQFFPTMMSSPARATASSPLFGEGAVLRNRHGERFMLRYDPNADMATRDVMSQSIFREVQAGNGVDGGAYMDLSAVPVAVLEKKFRTLLQLLRTHGVDPSKQWLVVSPATHFVMGGAWIDVRCRTGIAGLFAAGEAAGGVHGANRLSGNALVEAIVFGATAGREAAAYSRDLRRAPEPEAAHTELPREQDGRLSVSEVKAEIRRAMWEHASLVRTEAGLLRARAVLQECLESLPRCWAGGPSMAAYLEVRRMAQVGMALVAAALERRESRGAHYRTDYPERDDRSWLGSTRVRKVDEELRVDFVPLRHESLPEATG